MNFISRLLAHDMRLLVRQKTDAAALVFFFLIVIILLPFTLGPDPDLLRRLAPSLIWLASLLMCLLALDRLFVQDARDGTLDLMLLSPHPMSLLVFSKLLAQTGLMLFVLAIMVFPAAILLNLDWAMLPPLMLSLSLGIPSLIFLGGIMAAVTIAIPRHPALMILLLIPFYIPILIFAVMACDQAALGLSPRTDLLFLAAILAFLLPTAPVVIAGTLRLGQE